MNATINSKQLHRSEGQTFVAELSDFEQTFRFKQIYPDAADEGMTVVSNRTGREVDYVVVKVDQMPGEDFEIAGWNLEPTAKSLRQVPACRGTKLLIIND
jgi:hypothetical protein